MSRQSKIARLKKVHRDALNNLIQDGAMARTIMNFVAGLAEAGEQDADGNPVREINDANLSTWRAGGYQDWLKTRERIEDMAAKREFAQDIVKSGEGAAIQEASLNIAASQLFELLTDVDLTGLKDKLRDKPEIYPEVIRSLAPIAKAALDIEKFRDNVRQRKEAIARELGAAKKSGGITKETIEKIERELKLL